jgi:hypothetical protein
MYRKSLEARDYGFGYRSAYLPGCGDFTGYSF